MPEENKEDKFAAVEVWCEHCGRYVSPEATGYSLEHARLPVVADRDNLGRLVSELDWSAGDIEIDFEYLCPECGGTLFEDLDTLDKMFTRRRADGNLEARLK